MEDPTASLSSGTEVRHIPITRVNTNNTLAEASRILLSPTFFDEEVAETIPEMKRRRILDEGDGLALITAASKGNVDELRCLIENKGVGVNELIRGTTPLLTASLHGQTTVVRYLTEHGAVLNQAAQNGATPLYLASYNGHFETVRYLTEQRAAQNVLDNGGRTPLLAATLNRHTDIVQYLAQDGPVNQGSNYGCTPLHAASGNKDLQSVAYLIEGGADVHQADIYGHTPLSIATESGSIEVANFLQSDACKALGNLHVLSSGYKKRGGGILSAVVENMASTLLVSTLPAVATNSCR